MKKIYEKQFHKHWNPFRLITNEEYEMNLRTIIWAWVMMKGVKAPEKMTQKTAQIKKQCHK